MKKRKHNTKLLLTIAIVLFVIAVFGITLNYLIINKEYSGKIDVKNKYADILFNNIYIESNNISVKQNDEEKTIHVNIEELQNENEFYIDLINIGNIDKKIETSIKNFNSNVDSNLINIEVKNEDNIILGGESKRIYVYIKYSNNKKDTIANLSFNINFNFE